MTDPKPTKSELDALAADLGAGVELAFARAHSNPRTRAIIADALRQAAAAAEAKPVAWLIHDTEFDDRTIAQSEEFAKAKMARANYVVTPLYATPPAASDAYAAGEAAGIARAAKFIEQRAPECSGPDWGIASDETRQAWSRLAEQCYGYAAAIRALAVVIS